MPICQHCGHPWSRLETIKASFTLGAAMTCPNCETKQYLTPQSRKKGTYFSLLVPVFLLVTSLLGLGWLSFFLYIGTVSAAFYFFYPPTVELTDEEKPLW
ncbi:TIGR04104 family putative zinc finger protein [Bacillus thermotolerans]|uniref:Cxxc_20_cxxc protein n=1 Tax=Bacillus thermotolerans TaxID=1221996 RepID=A0A0F5HJ59_BACTR|nr:TIGR04104 family putative zinc finger protein [Bacillus thermotolerans]KKB33283.1 hypothetical protein QY97_03588 [Bacillus thermotolerans]KKB36595.1 hypothetical protein QY95_03104 [Bacillus thermotolerans]KKB44784.1 hypothetical protein QY96_01065 [Bacillus thermotolerans]